MKPETLLIRNKQIAQDCVDTVQLLTQPRNGESVNNIKSKNSRGYTAKSLVAHYKQGAVLSENKILSDACDEISRLLEAASHK